MRRTPPPVGSRRFDLLVVGDANPDVIVSGVPEEILYAQVEQLVDTGTLTIGGSAAILACGATRLGLRTALVALVGDDAAGRFMLQQLAARGVDTSSCVTSPPPVRKAAVPSSSTPAAVVSVRAARSSARVEPWIPPSPSKRTAASIWDEISVRSASA